MQIVVSVLLPDPVNERIPGLPDEGPGQRWIFSKNLVLERHDNITPGNLMPQQPELRLAGSYSGLVTTLRVAQANDPFYQPGSYLFQYEAIFKLDAVADTPLQKGQNKPVARRLQGSYSVTDSTEAQSIRLRASSAEFGAGQCGATRGLWFQVPPPMP